MFRSEWIRALFLVQAFQISYPVFSLHDSPSYFGKSVNISAAENLSRTKAIENDGPNQTHRVIKRFTPHFHFPPPPHLPTLPRPNFPFPIPMFDRYVKGDDDEGEESDESGETTTVPPEPSGDRTLLAAKKAILLKKAVVVKKAIILAKLKKKAIFKKKKRKKFKKKAIIAGLAGYGYNKIKGGVSIKTPNIKLTVGGAGKDKEEEEEEEAEDDTESSTKKTENQNNKQTQDKQQQNVPSPQTYTSSKKKGKKKKKKGIPKPRPVNLGVKANLYKKFDKAAKKAKDQLSSYVQIDIDFLNGRSTIDELIEPTRFTSRIAKVSSAESDELGVRDLYASGNYIQPWKKPNWSREYPSRKKNVEDDKPFSNGNNCCLKPVYILFSLPRDKFVA
ncbi:unnamed protein product [Orchesella dallaii]|uniref:Uncharacterized protein n=1 Tax=Orchesella dallaii TaxID=48710 RepID=A0ABP1RNA9_9HEXA